MLTQLLASVLFAPDLTRVNPFVFPEIFSAVLLLFLGVVVYANNRKNAINLSFAFLCLVLAGHCFGVFFADCSPNLLAAFYWARIAFLFLIFLIPSFLGFIATFLDFKFKKELFVMLYLISFAFLVILFSTSYFFETVQLSGSLYPRYQVIVGVGYLLYGLLFLASIILGFLLLYRARMLANGIRQTQISYLMSAIIIGGLLGVSGMAFMFFNKTAHFTYFVPYIGASFYALLVGYAILRHRLMDISFIIRKGLVYSLTIGLFTGVYIFGLLLFGQFLQGFAGRAYFFVTLASIIVFAIAFQPLKTHLQVRIDRLFFKEKYNYQKTLKELSQATTVLTDLDSLLHKISRTIVDRIKVDQCSIYCYDRDQLVFRQREAYNKENVNRD